MSDGSTIRETSQTILDFRPDIPDQLRMENIRQTFTDATGLLSKAVKDANIHDEASVVFNRAKQYTEEKLGKAERTQLDPHLVMLETKTDNMKNLTEKLKNNSAAVLVPNPGKFSLLLVV